MRLPYAEGTAFLVPLDGGGVARGVAVRVSPRGKVLLGYFFGPRLGSSAEFSWDGLQPAAAVLRLRCGDLGLVNGDWPIVGQVPGWNRAMWPMPDFVRRDPLGRLPPLLVRYSDYDPQRIDCEIPIQDDEGLGNQSLSGAGAVATRLNKLLADRISG